MDGEAENEGAEVGAEAPLATGYKNQKDNQAADEEEVDYNTNEEAGVDVKEVVDGREVDGEDGVEIDAGAAAEDEMYSVEKENGSVSKTSLNGVQGHVEVGVLAENDSANEGENEVGVEIENAKEEGGYRSYEVAEAEAGDVELGVAGDVDSRIHNRSYSAVGGDTYTFRRTTSYLGRGVW